MLPSPSTPHAPPTLHPVFLTIVAMAWATERVAADETSPTIVVAPDLPRLDRGREWPAIGLPRSALGASALVVVTLILAVAAVLLIDRITTTAEERRRRSPPPSILDDRRH